VHLHPSPEKGFALSVDLDVTLPSVDDPEVAAEIVRAAHAVCPYSNATRGNIEVRLSANGAAVS
jgi:organic hydroperoxide reductase OsmC/OhrA